MHHHCHLSHQPSTVLDCGCDFELVGSLKFGQLTHCLWAHVGDVIETCLGRVVGLASRTAMEVGLARYHHRIDRQSYASSSLFSKG